MENKEMNALALGHEFVLRANEVEKIVNVAKENGIILDKQEYLYICNLVFGNPYMDSLARLAGCALGKPEKVEEKEGAKDE